MIDHISNLKIKGSSNIGLYAYANDQFCLVGKDVVSIEAFKVLQVPIHQITIGGSSQVGIFIAGNSKGIVVPEVITESEADMLKELGISYTIIETKHTALGNNLIVNDNHCFYNPELEKTAVKEICKALDVSADPLPLKTWDVVGAVVAVTSRGGLISKEISEDIKKAIQKKLKVPLEPGSLNFGSPAVAGCVVANKNGFVVGEASAGIEITNADLAFGFIE
jgi:translation initiation factor 6